MPGGFPWRHNATVTSTPQTCTPPPSLKYPFSSGLPPDSARHQLAQGGSPGGTALTSQDASRQCQVASAPAAASSAATAASGTARQVWHASHCTQACSAAGRPAPSAPAGLGPAGSGPTRPSRDRLGRAAADLCRPLGGFPEPGLAGLPSPVRARLLAGGVSASERASSAPAEPGPLPAGAAEAAGAAREVPPVPPSPGPSSSSLGPLSSSAASLMVSRS